MLKRKNYFNISIIILLLSNPLIADIYLPEVSNEMWQLVDKSVRSKARIDAFNIKKPVIDQALKKQVKQLGEQSDKNIAKYHPLVKSLVDKTINNKAWKFKQSQLIKGLNKDLDIEEQKNTEISGHRLYLFVSSSMPKNKMRQYVRQLPKYPNAQILIRGFIGGGKKMRPTMAYLKSIITKDENCSGIHCKTYKTKFNIDPVLFQRYQISKVPALVYVDELSGASYCSEGNTNIVNARGVHKFVGLAPIKYMIQVLADKTKLAKLEQLLEL